MCLPASYSSRYLTGLFLSLYDAAEYDPSHACNFLPWAAMLIPVSPSLESATTSSLLTQLRLTFAGKLFRPRTSGLLLSVLTEGKTLTRAVGVEVAISVRRRA